MISGLPSKVLLIYETVCFFVTGAFVTLEKGFTGSLCSAKVSNAVLVRYLSAFIMHDRIFICRAIALRYIKNAGYNMREIVKTGG